jgi:hypothetical protein
MAGESVRTVRYKQVLDNNETIINVNNPSANIASRINSANDNDLNIGNQSNLINDKNYIMKIPTGYSFNNKTGQLNPSNTREVFIRDNKIKKAIKHFFIKFVIIFSIIKCMFLAFAFSQCTTHPVVHSYYMIATIIGFAMYIYQYVNILKKKNFKLYIINVNHFRYLYIILNIILIIYLIFIHITDCLTFYFIIFIYSIIETIMCVIFHFYI